MLGADDGIALLQHVMLNKLQATLSGPSMAGSAH